MYDEGRYLDDERAGMREGEGMARYDKPSATWIVSPWLGTLAERSMLCLCLCVQPASLTTGEVST